MNLKQMIANFSIGKEVRASDRQTDLRQTKKRETNRSARVLCCKLATNFRPYFSPHTRVHFRMALQ